MRANFRVAIVGLAATLAVSACGATGRLASGGAPASPATGSPSPAGGGCLTTVQGQVPGPESLTASWLPPGFRLSSGDPNNPASMSGPVTYSAPGADPPRVELSVSYQTGTVSQMTAPAPTTAITIQGQPALITTGPPDPAFIGVYWKPNATQLLTVSGYKLPSATVEEVAQHTVFTGGGPVSLPIDPGAVVDRSEAIAAARPGTSSGAATAKLTSWTELSALVASSGATAPSVTGTLDSAPWTPVWAVLAPAQAGPTVAVIDAASGRLDLTVPAGSDQGWFAALTDRSLFSASDCPGGSTARLPFGVLTRDEEAYTVRNEARSNAQQSASVILKLTTVPALYAADPGLYGGCVRMDCSLNELVWPTIDVVQAAPGTTIACLPPSAMVPPGYQPTQVTEYVSISVPDNSGIGCGPPPALVTALPDLAPAG